eukprot:2558809-Amphidinium_carterae.2
MALRKSYGAAAQNLYPRKCTPDVALFELARVFIRFLRGDYCGATLPQACSTVALLLLPKEHGCIPVQATTGLSHASLRLNAFMDTGIQGRQGSTARQEVARSLETAKIVGSPILAMKLDLKKSQEGLRTSPLAAGLLSSSFVLCVIMYDAHVYDCILELLSQARSTVWRPQSKSFTKGQTPCRHSTGCWGVQ